MELLLNGASLGRAATNENRAVFETSYCPGELTAISFDGEKEISRDTLRSGGEAAGIRIRAEKENLPANGEDICFATVEVVDADGNLVPYAKNEMTVEVTGAAKLLAFGSARPKTEENYVSGCVKAYKGRALAVLRAGAERGTATLTIRAAGLGETSLSVNVG